MASGKKQLQQLARQLFKLSFDNGELSAERVAGVLAYVEKNKPVHIASLLKAYHRLVAAEISRRQAVVEHAGPIDQTALDSIASAMTRRYGHTVKASAKPNSSLLAGIRVRVGDDTYESSVAGQLSALAASL
jgi:F-type H+-transporting ATPase subunit delta